MFTHDFSPSHVLVFIIWSMSIVYWDPISSCLGNNCSSWGPLSSYIHHLTHQQTKSYTCKRYKTDPLFKTLYYVPPTSQQHLRLMDAQLIYTVKPQPWS